MTVFVKPQNRAVISVSGNDRYDFLQGLITQDIDLLKSQDLIYSCLLTPNGKFLFDFFIFEDGNALMIECEGGERANTLLKRLSMFKLRSDVDLDLVDDVDVFQIFTLSSSSGLSRGSSYREQDSQNKSGNDNTVLFKDPRFDGYRTYKNPSSCGLTTGSHDTNQTDPAIKSQDDIISEIDFKTWDEHRISAEIPDGSRDMIPEKSFLHESKVIIDTAVSYTKGCYMGQELVSRMHHRGLVKKQLRCVEINSIPDDAELRSSCGDTGLALVKL